MSDSAGKWQLAEPEVVLGGRVRERDAHDVTRRVGGESGGHLGGSGRIVGVGLTRQTLDNPPVPGGTHRLEAKSRVPTYR